MEYLSMKSYSNNILLFLWMMSFVFVLNCLNWFWFWISLEINTLSFTLILMSGNQISSQSGLIYFSCQTFSSFVFLFCILFLSYMPLYMHILIMIMMMLKMGLFPFHFWAIQCSEGIEYLMLFLLFTFQKILPLYCLTMISLNKNMVLLFMLINILFSSLMLMNQISMRKFMTFSSLNHISWLVATMYFMENMWLFYIFMYMMFMYFMMIMLLKYNINSVMALMLLNYNDMIIMMIILLNLMGFPPFLGFLLKFSILISTYNNMSLFLGFLISSFINCAIYVRLIIFFINNVWMFNNKNLKFFNYEMLMFFSVMYFLYFVLLLMF